MPRAAHKSDPATASLAPADAPLAPIPGSARHAELTALVVAHASLAGLIARRYGRRGVDVEELTAAGMQGLWAAALHFDPSRGFAFSTYAAQCVRSSVLETIRVLGFPVCRKRGNTDPLFGVSLDQDVAGEVLGETADESAGVDPIAMLERDERTAGIAAAMASLDVRTVRVLRASFGFDGDGGQSDARIARAIGLSEARVRQIRRAGMRRLEEHPQLVRLMRDPSTDGGDATRELRANRGIDGHTHSTQRTA